MKDEKAEALVAVNYALAHCRQLANENRCEFIGEVWHIHGSELLVTIKLQYLDGSFTNPE